MQIKSASDDSIDIDVGPIPDLAQLERMWRRVDLSGQHSFFLTWHWIGAWLKSLSTFENLNLMEVRVRDDLVGLAIIAVVKDRLHGIIPIKRAWLHATGIAEQDRITVEHNGIACNAGLADQIWAAIADWFSNRSCFIDEIVLPGCSFPWNCNAAHRHLVRDNPEHGFRCGLEHVRVGGGLDAILTRNSRQQLSRSRRQCEKVGALVLTVASDMDHRREFLFQLSQFHTASWHRRGNAGAFNTPYFQMFCRELIESDRSEHAVQLLQLSAGSKPLGYLLNFEHRGVVYNYQSGFDDTDPTLRPGYVTHAFAIRHYAEHGLKYYDFLAKGNQLKRTFSTEEYILHWERIRKPRLSFRAEHMIRNFIGR